MSSDNVIGELSSFMSGLKKADMKPHTTDITIDGLVYTSTKVGARIGWELMPRLGTLLGSAFSSMMSTAGEEEDDSLVDGAAILAVCDRAMKDGLMPLTEDVLQGMECNELCGFKDKPGRVLGVFDEHFAGEYIHLVKVLLFALRHNYLGFSRGSL